MGVGRIFSKSGPLGDFSYIFPGGDKSDEIYFFPHETRKTTFFAENFKIQGGLGHPLHPPSDAHVWSVFFWAQIGKNWCET